MGKIDISRDYYQDLELKPGADVNEVKKQFKRLALKYHPDRNPGKEKEVEPLFQAINEAHGFLSDPTTKFKYDHDRQKAGYRGYPVTPRTTAVPPRNTYPSAYYAPPPPPPPPPPQSRPQYNTTASSAREYETYGRTKQGGGPKVTSSAARYEAFRRMREPYADSHTPKSASSRAATPGGIPPNRANTPSQTNREAGGSNYHDHRAGFEDSLNGSARARRKGYAPDASVGDEPPAPDTSAYRSSASRSSDAHKMPQEGSFGGHERVGTPYAKGGYPSTPLGRSTSARGRQQPPSFAETSEPQITPNHRRGVSASKHKPEKSGRASRPRDDIRSSRTPTGGHAWVESGSSGNEYDTRQRRSSIAHEHKVSSRRTPQTTAEIPPRGPTCDHDRRPASASGQRPSADSSFQTRDDMFAHTPTVGVGLRSKSTENIHTRMFSPNEWSDKLGDVFRFPPPTNTVKRDHRNRSPRRTQNRPPVTQRGTVPLAPAGIFVNATAPSISLKDPPPTLKPTGFSQDAWTDSIKPNDFQNPPLTSERPNLRMKSGKPTRTPSRVSKASLGATVGSDEETSAYDRSGSKSAESSSSRSSGFSGSAMEIDPPIPEREKERSQGLPPRPAYVSNFDDGRVPLANVGVRQEFGETPRSARRSSSTMAPPPTKQLGQQSTAQTTPTRQPPPRAATSLGHSCRTERPTIDLKDLGNVEPLASTNGLEGMSSMASSLPFKSRPSSTTSLPRQDLELPMPPRSPDVPPHPNISEAWREYSTGMDAYVREWRKFDDQMLTHFEARKAQTDGFPPSWLLSAGELNKGGFLTYMQGLKQDERVRAHWNVAWDKHFEAMQAFEKVRTHVLGLVG